MTRNADSIGNTVYDPWTEYTLRALDDAGNTALAAELDVEGFGGFGEVAFDLAVTSVTFTAGTAPTAQLRAWVQRMTANEQWDDLLAFQTAAFLGSGAGSPNVAPVYHAGHYLRSLGPALAPGAIQDCGGSPPFSQRSGWCSDRLRVKHQLVLGGGVSPSAALLRWSLVARGRP